MLNLTKILKYTALLLLLSSFIIELFIVGIENRVGILTVQYSILYGFFLIVFIFGKIYYNSFFKRILLFLLLISLLGIFSSNLVITYNYLAKFAAGLLFFAIGYSYFYDENDLKILIIFSMIMLSLGLIIVFYNNSIGSGISLYDNDFFGQSKSNTYNVFSILMIFLLSQIDILSKRQKIVVIILSFFSLLMLLMLFKRTPFLIIFSSLIFLVYFNSKRRNFKNIITILLVLLFLFVYTYPYYEVQLKKSFESRESEFESSLTEEGRYLENFVVIDKISQDPTSLFIGTREVFNSRGKVSPGERMLHNDYANILWSSGLVGFFLFFGNIITLLLNFWGKIKMNKINEPLKRISVTGFLLLMCYLLCAMGQAWTSITILGTIMFFTGSCLRVVSQNNEHN